ncbi:hypothetical protein MTX78_22640 [Hymenobacter tibetensis]|uniref:Uncharacterized protein n=1 Tax=Hymenobacter tibetensis TaxID=497967 RepID=A0ABY4CXA0_9BACT|nr:hypothetical protein [Hymenobacter tibetensis]UOG74900.1 hypothetical protein MTX78_22640 [Hymenobacter tibetensis]
MFRCSFLLLLSFMTGTAGAQNRAPVEATRRNPTERVSPLPGVTLPAGVGQDKAEPVPAPTQVRPNGTLPLPAFPRGNVTVGPVDSGQVQPATRRAAPSAPPRRKLP